MSSTPHYYSYYIIIVATLVLCETLVCRYRYIIYTYTVQPMSSGTHTRTRTIHTIPLVDYRGHLRLCFPTRRAVGRHNHHF